MNIHQLNHLNTGLIILSAIIAWYLPLPVFLLAYAVLGPLHYLTEISWLKDRDYYLARPSFAAFLYAIVIIGIGWQLATGQIIYGLMFVSFMLVLIVQLPIKPIVQMVLGAVVLGASPLLIRLPAIELIFALLLPTLIHVVVFTWLFMLAGSLKSQSAAGFFSCFVYLVCLMGLFILPESSSQTRLSSEYLKMAEGFIPLAERMVQLANRTLSLETLQASFRVLAFAYTYHYLNWFSKTQVLQWHKMPLKRALLIGGLWLGSMGIYAYDYQLGLLTLLGLSILHVVLEFPLNLQTMGMLAQTGSSHLGQMWGKEKGAKA